MIILLNGHTKGQRPWRALNPEHKHYPSDFTFGGFESAQSVHETVLDSVQKAFLGVIVPKVLTLFGCIPRQEHCEIRYYHTRPEKRALSLYREGQNDSVDANILDVHLARCISRAKLGRHPLSWGTTEIRHLLQLLKSTITCMHMIITVITSSQVDIE
uniref:uncharacterized protein LOC122586762 n=1 Tax=Erigeron canadensis TaxID=72917 RepID=UPI001CB8E7E5|nr:uncharacterized protein LOC122586762 [Erigeron canadensis]